jgi:hypothetical protein
MHSRVSVCAKISGNLQICKFAIPALIMHSSTNMENVFLSNFSFLVLMNVDDVFFHFLVTIICANTVLHWQSPLVITSIAQWFSTHHYQITLSGPLGPILNKVCPSSTFSNSCVHLIYLIITTLFPYPTQMMMHLLCL